MRFYEDGGLVELGNDYSYEAPVEEGLVQLGDDSGDWQAPEGYEVVYDAESGESVMVPTSEAANLDAGQSNATQVDPQILEYITRLSNQGTGVQPGQGQSVPGYKEPIGALEQFFQFLGKPSAAELEKMRADKTAGPQRIEGTNNAWVTNPKTGEPTLVQMAPEKNTAPWWTNLASLGLGGLSYLDRKEGNKIAKSTAEMQNQATQAGLQQYADQKARATKIKSPYANMSPAQTSFRAPGRG